MFGGSEIGRLRHYFWKTMAVGICGVTLVALGFLAFDVHARSERGSTSAVASKDGANTLLRLAQARNKAGEYFNGNQRSAIETIIREYLLKNPEILLQMQTEFERRMEVAQQERVKVALTENADAIFRSATAPVVGNKDGDVTVVEFFDYNCGFCRRAIGGMAKLVDDDKNVKVVFKEFPIFGKESEDAARIALAAGKQGKYWELHRALLETPGRSNKDKGLRLAKKLGLDTVKLEADMTSDDVNKEIEEVRKLADIMGIRGTPHFLIGDKVIPGAPEDLYDQLKFRISEVRDVGCEVC